MKEKIDELLEDFKGRLKNPLILSFILVWFYYHWAIIYWVLTVEDSITVDPRTDKITKYITEQGFCGMVLCPLITSFGSLVVYYLIANSSQFIQIWVGKRLNVAMLLKSDKGRYVERVILEKEKKKNKELNNQINELSQEIDRIKRNKDDSEKLVDDLEIERDEAVLELGKAKQNIDYNLSFKKSILKPLIYLLGKENGISVNGLSTPNLLKKDYTLLQGNWEINDFSSIDNDTHSVTVINIEEKEVTYFDGKEYGTLTQIQIDFTTSILNFKILRKEVPMQIIENYHVVQINKNEYIGIMNNSYINFKRRKAT